MYQSEIDRAVALATGESIREIQRRGFSIANPIDADFDPEPDTRHPSMIDWDLVQGCGTVRW